MKQRKFIDLSHEIENGMITYKGLPAPVISDFLTREDSRKNYAQGTEFSIRKIEMVATTGTYLDSPYHRYADGKDLAALPLSSLANLEGLKIVVSYERSRSVSSEAFRGKNLKGKAVLIQTGWDVHWRTERYSQGHPFLTRDAAEHLLMEGAALVAIDAYNIDDTSDPYRPVHSILLGAEIPIVEHLCNMRAIPEEGFRFFAIPVKIKDFGTFPVRAFAMI